MEPRKPDKLERYRGRWLALLVILIAVALLLPGQKSSDNHVRWRDPGPGLQFDGIAQALSERPIFSETGSLTLEVWLVPGFVPGAGNQEIISFNDAHRVRPLLLGQFPRGFFLRGRADNPSGKPRADRYIGIQEARANSAPDLNHLAVTVSPAGARLHVNGHATDLELPKTTARPGEPFGGYLMLGSSDTGWPAWTGGILGVAIFDRELTDEELRSHADEARRVQEQDFRNLPGLIALYDLADGPGANAANGVPMSPDLMLPVRMTRPNRPSLLSPRSFDLSDWRCCTMDALLNILGFMPLGFVICWRKAPSSLLVAVAAGCTISLSAELLQAWIPGRFSSIVDVGNNSVGSLLGGLIAWLGSIAARASQRASTL